MKWKHALTENPIDQDDRAALITWLSEDPWLTKGALTEQFEREWADYIGIKHAVFVNSGSSANLLMFYASLLSDRLRNKTVILPAVSWSTSVAPAMQLGFRPILCDAEVGTWGVDPERLEELVAKHNPGAVLIVHMLGVPCNMNAILEIQRKYNFLLMEDCCPATGSLYKHQDVGTFGDMSSFSFYYVHHITTIEGGMICTNDDKFHESLLMLRSHGWAKDIRGTQEEELAGHWNIPEFNRTFTFYAPGFNVRSTDLNAFIGLQQMKKLSPVVLTRVRNHEIYQERFRENDDFTCQHNKDASICSIGFGALAATSFHRHEIATVLEGRRIETRPLACGNVGLQPFWMERYGRVNLPVADSLYYTGFQLPNHARLTGNDVHAICDAVLLLRSPNRWQRD